MRDDNFQQKLNDGYIELAKKFNLPIIDATQTPDEILTEIEKIINKALAHQISYAKL